MVNPLKAIMNIRRSELPLALLMFGYFFMVITSFWILKPIKKALFIQFYDQSGFILFDWWMRASQAELLAKVLNMFVAMLAVIVFTWLSRRYRRQQLSYIFSGFFLLCYVVFSYLLTQPAGITVWSFYLFGDLFSTLMVATFFVFLNDSMSPDSAKRLYGLIGLGGVVGGVFGTTVVRVWIDSMSSAEWLWICFAIAIVIAVIAMAAGKIVDRTPQPVVRERKIEPEPERKEKARNPAMEGAALVFKSPYLLSIAAIVGLYEIVSTLLDFQFTETISHYLDGADIGRQFSTVFTITNWVSMFVQFFLTSLIMTRFGLTRALMVLPIAVLAGSVGFMALPILWVGSLLNTVDNGFSYSINQSAKETLYVPTIRNEKYKAKAFIDMFVQRFAKVIAVGVSLLVTTIFVEFGSIRYLSLFTVAVIIVWIIAVRYAGRRFGEMAGEEVKQ